MQSVPKTPEVQRFAPPAWKILLKEQGRTMTWLARATGKAQTTVYAYAYGHQRAPEEWLVRVAELLGVDLEEVA